jgi:hypothetical protein
MRVGAALVIISRPNDRAPGRSGRLVQYPERETRPIVSVVLRRDLRPGARKLVLFEARRNSRVGRSDGFQQ